MKKFMTFALIVAGALSVNPAIGAEVPIPRTMADKGKYFLLAQTQAGEIITTVHKRVGMNEIGYSKTEINCKAGQYRDMGYSEDGPEKIKVVPSKWTDTLNGSSKSDLVSFVCSRK